MATCSSKIEKEDLDAFKGDFKEEVIDTQKKLRVGIIGTGWIAGTHMKVYQRMPDVEIVALADLVPGKAEAFGKTYGIPNAKCYPSHKELIDSGEVDAVSVCTYNTTHAECTIYALEKGVHVLLEKPMCLTLEEAVEICRAEKKSGCVLSIGFQPRFDNSMKLVKEIVESGALGKIYYIQTGGGRRRGIPAPFGTTFIEKEKGGMGALADIGCYSLDMLLNAIGYPKPLTVSGYTSDFFGKDPAYWTSKGKPAEYAQVFGVDDFAAAFVRLEGDIVLDFRISWAMNMDTSGDALILGTKGGLRIPSTECWNGSVGGPLKLYQQMGKRSVVTEFPVPAAAKESNFYYKIRSFLDAVKNGEPSPVPSSQIIINQAILDGICKSAEQRKEIEIQIPEI